MIAYGLVLKSTGNDYWVRVQGHKTIKVKLRGRIRIDNRKHTNPVAVGDRVRLEKRENGNFVILDVEERKNYLIRKSVNLSKRTHILAANLDQIFLFVTTKNPKTTTTFIDRFLCSAQAYRIPVIILFHKFDTLNSESLEYANSLKNLYESIGYSCIETSAETGLNLDIVKEKMKNKISMFGGHSGVGKSTLANTIQPDLDIKIGETSESHLSGMHTTTFAEMHPLDFGGYLIDTPGIKGFGLVEMTKEEIGDYFPEIYKLKPQCKYSNCLHLHEPDCAVLKNVSSGNVAQSRHKSYTQLLQDDSVYSHR